MILITRDRVVPTASPEVFANARRRFQREACLPLPGLLDRALLEQLLDAVDRSGFYERVHPGIGVESCVRPGSLTTALELIFNDRHLFDLMNELTGCGPIGCFDGRIYRLVPGTDHHDSWHSDAGQDRRVAMSISFGRQPFEGGVLQIRASGSPDILKEISNPTPGDGILFRIDPAYQHRVAPLQGKVPRTAYAGWFCEQPDYRMAFKARRSVGADRYSIATP